MSCGRCTGHCCQIFVLPFTPAELAWKVCPLNPNAKDLHPRGDMALVPYMAIPLGDDFAKLSPELRAIAAHMSHATPGQLKFYTCTHFDKPTGNCGNYENRPAMCSTFPYGRPCEYVACAAPKEPRGERAPGDTQRDAWRTAARAATDAGQPLPLMVDVYDKLRQQGVGSFAHLDHRMAQPYWWRPDHEAGDTLKQIVSILEEKAHVQ